MPGAGSQGGTCFVESSSSAWRCSLEGPFTVLRPRPRNWGISTEDGVRASVCVYREREPPSGASEAQPDVPLGKDLSPWVQGTRKGHVSGTWMVRAWRAVPPLFPTVPKVNPRKPGRGSNSLGAETLSRRDSGTHVWAWASSV